MFRIFGSLALTALLIVTSACSGGPLSKLDNTLDYAPLFFQGLVITHAITQAQADTYNKGVDRFETIADNTKKCLSDNVFPDSKCYLDMGADSYAAISEFYPNVSNDKVSKYVALVREIVDLIIRKNVPSVGGPVGVSNQSLDAKIDELNRLLNNKQ